MIRVAALALMITVAGCAMPAVAQTAASVAPNRPAPGFLEKDLADLTTMMTGRWDNDRHNFFAEDAQMDQSILAPRQHFIIQPMEDGGDSRLRATRRATGAPDTELIQVFSMDVPRSAIRQTILRPGGELEDEPIGCDVIWTRSAAGFSGKAEGAACPQVFPRPADGGALSVTTEISDTDFWVTATRGVKKSEARMRRARPFECWTAVLRGAKHGDSGEDVGDDKWDFQSGVMLHDQYGEAVLTTDETPPRKIGLRLRNVDWPYGKNRPSLTLYVHEAESDRALSYVWSEYDSERLGINLRWLQASCTYAPDKMFEDF